MDKQHILDEIRRTAKANNDEPLGVLRFLKETGIKQSDWHGKFWVRWSEALEEAGFAPNQMTLAYEDDYLIESFISLIRELGHFPVKGEVRLKAYNDLTFPSHTTFSSRLGSKKQIVAKVVDYCREREGYDDVIELCSGLNSLDEQPATEIETQPQPEQVGFIYLLKSGRYYKIGRTNSVGRREWEIKLQLPEEPKLVHSITTDDPIGIEAYWHNRFKAKRKNGEWFELNREDIQAFKRRKFM